jgi:hypothetical protein
MNVKAIFLPVTRRRALAPFIDTPEKDTTGIWPPACCIFRIE